MLSLKESLRAVETRGKKVASKGAKRSFSQAIALRECAQGDTAALRPLAIRSVLPAGRALHCRLGPPIAEERGALLESWVATTLQAHAETQHLYDELSYWAPHQSTLEVHFLLQRGGELLAIEVKASSRYHTSLLKGLRALGPLPGLVRRVLVYTGERSFKSSDGVEIWPAHRFAMEIAGSALWP